MLLQVREQSVHIADLECNVTKLKQALSQQQSHMHQQLSTAQQVSLPTAQWHVSGQQLWITPKSEYASRLCKSCILLCRQS